MRRLLMVSRWLTVLVVALVGLAFILSCGGNSTGSGGTVQTTLSDPPTCGHGPFTNDFDHVYVTITKVTANINGDAGPNDSGWQTLVDLTGSPMQVDLLTLNPTATPGFCGTLFMLGQKNLPPGKYQQIRLFLLSNNAPSGPSSNACGTAGFNCVIPSGSTTPAELQLSSESQTGIKIPSSQIISGGLTVSPGQSVDLNIDFDSCASIVVEGSMMFRLKPVLHAGETSLNQNTIQGSVVDSSSGNPISGAAVLLEQPSTITGITDPVDGVKDAMMTGSDGSFIFCVQGTPGTTTYDVAIAAQTTGAAYNPDVVFGVPVGTNLGALRLVSEGSGSMGGTLAGQVTSDTTSTGEDITLSPLVELSNNGTMTLVTIPWLSTNTGQPMAQPQNFMTATPANGTTPCPSGNDCFDYSITLPASAAQVGVFSSGSANLPPPPASPTLSITYSLLGTVPQPDTTTTPPTHGCTGSTPSPAITPASPALTVTPGMTTNVSTVLAFTGCS